MERELPEGFVEADATELEWLEQACGARFFTGIDPTPAFDAACRIYHAMYRAPFPSPDDVTHDTVRLIEEHEGIREPVSFPGVEHLLAASVAMGIPLDWHWPPEGWERLRWSELTRELGMAMDATWVGDRDFAPWPPSRSWPASIMPPPESTLDLESFQALIDILDGTDEIVAAYCWLDDANNRWDKGPMVYRGPFATVGETFDRHSGSAANWWPSDRAWTVWTDYDLNTTVFAGSRELVERVVADERLEALWTSMPVDLSHA